MSQPDGMISPRWYSSLGGSSSTVSERNAIT